MAPPPLLSLADIRLGWGGRPLFQGVALSIARGDRVALVGRNGSGKSTLLKVMAGLVAADAGERFVQPGAGVAYLPQEPDFAGFETLGAYAAADLPDNERFKAEMALDALQARAGIAPETASGGEKRRAALARLLAAEPDLMLLDEPTNHLDVAAIQWLEETLRQSRAGFVLISHDRAFLSALTRATLWIDRGATRRLDRGFAEFEDWRDKVFEEEEAEAHKLDRRIAREEHWVVHGVSGRRKRNVKRLARLAELKEARRTAVKRQGPAAMDLSSGRRSGKLVVEADAVAKAFDGRAIFQDLSLKIHRGDRIAIVGPNGVGKTTLLNVLTGATPPDAGRLRLGAELTMAVFDQTRAQLDPETSLWETLTEDRALGVRGANDQVMVRGKPKHVVGYLKEFLFDERQARGPVSALSGGERARLLLAKIMARESNLLVLDEPTNDLDVETLDLLQEVLSEYDGTLLLVSHDRDFIDRVADATIAMEGDGRATVYAGGWSDYQAQRAAGPDDAPRRASGRTRDLAKDADPAASEPTSNPISEPDKADRSVKKLGYKERRRLDELPREIDRLTAEIGKLEQLLADPDLFSKTPKKFEQATELLAERQEKLLAAEEEWLELEARREEIEGGG